MPTTNVVYCLIAKVSGFNPRSLKEGWGGGGEENTPKNFFEKKKNTKNKKPKK